MTRTSLRLRAPSFQHGADIPARHTCEGRDVSPALEWGAPPPGTASFALIVDDPDAPGGTFTHWVIFDLPGDLERLEEDHRGAGVQGQSDFHKPAYGGPCPPPNHGDHRYYFKLYALDVPSLELPEGATREEVEQRMEGHVIAEGELMGRYRRRAN